MASWPVQEAFHRVAVQPGSTPKAWDKKELLRCCVTGTGINAGANLEGNVHPVFSHWIAAEAGLRRELEQPLLKRVGFSRQSGCLGSSAHEQRGTPASIVRHHQAHWATKEKRARWVGIARDALKNEFPKLIQWQIDHEMFGKKGWNGYTCRHPRGELGLDELDRHGRSRNLTILVMAEHPARMAELRRQGKSDSEEYLMTAFMATVTILHELGHAVYWEDRRALTKDLREPFYGGDLEMELGDSFVSAVFGGWVPVPIRNAEGLRLESSFVDGVAWRQALNWDHHRLRPKYRAHYSIPVDYIARLFQEESWSAIASPEEAATLIRPRLLAGDSNDIARHSLNLRESLSRANQHATAAIADFHFRLPHVGERDEGRGSGWIWNRRPGAWFRLPQFDGNVDLGLEQSAADAICAAVSLTRYNPRRSAQIENNAPTTTTKTSIPLTPLVLSITVVTISVTITRGICDGSREITLEELKKRLSLLIGVSLTELEKLFDA
ncbi:hypothetical protein F5Y17DRAFT_453970 [Xylariaceae sp. FL0594]|nr:hypothetical protein F5Y17DRAFT_453970 [Xylariaceae sp. FL0594]